MGTPVEAPRLIPWGPDRLELGEGARWVGHRVVLVDIPTGRLLEADPARPGPLTELAKIDVTLGAVAPVAGTDGSWIAACGTGIALLREGGRLEWMERPEDGKEVRMRMNDACADPAGRFWAGSMAFDFTPDAGSLYRVDPDGTVERVVDGVTISNGPAFDAAGTTMYFTDTARGRIERFHVDPETGALSERKLFVQMKTGRENPDGMAVDQEDHVWVAVWGSSEVRRYHPDGSLAETVRVPTRQPSSVCLIGSERPQLFVTSAATGLDSSDELAGAVFAMPCAVRGRPADAFRLG
ncbi:MAG TPA: SMP-30/gluconolactonase/LRE family protein [Candidatus Dormibacteraeota bacterium]